MPINIDGFDEYLTPREAAKLLGDISDETIRKWAKEGRFGFHRTLTGRFRIARSVVLQLREQQIHFQKT